MKYHHIPHSELGDGLRNRYFVCYDVSDPQRLIQTHKKMTGYGDPVQYSVFLCDLSEKEIVFMKEDLSGILNLNEDRILVVNIGPADGQSSKLIFTIGAPINIKSEIAVVI